MSGVGVSFGADRIYDVLKGLDKFPEDLGSATTLLFANMGADEVRYLLPVVAALRSEGVSAEIYPDAAKLKKQFDYAERKAIPFLSITGASEMEQGFVNLKDLGSGEQKSFTKDDLAGICAFLKQ
jgi:histidyl-tRNA synthetase